jgi:hypothetical protein
VVKRATHGVVVSPETETTLDLCGTEWTVAQHRPVGASLALDIWEHKYVAVGCFACRNRCWRGLPVSLSCCCSTRMRSAAYRGIANASGELAF